MKTGEQQLSGIILFRLSRLSCMLEQMKPLPHSWFEGDTLELAPKLLGKIVRRGACEGIIVEVEAYTTDPASHGRTLTPRSKLMRETYGRWYVYFTYGMHWCANVTTNKTGTGAILIRAVEPIAGIPLMKRRRKIAQLTNLCSGPAKFCEAFGITGKENGKRIGADFGIYDSRELSTKEIGASARIGIKNGTDLPWRFYIKDNPFVSKSPKKKTS